MISFTIHLINVAFDRIRYDPTTSKANLSTHRPSVAWECIVDLLDCVGNMYNCREFDLEVPVTPRANNNCNAISW